MTGVSFLPLLKGEPFTPRKHVFTERGPHGSAPVTVTMNNSGFDLSRAVRSDRYKFIYNCTPWIPYGPVDSARRRRLAADDLCSRQWQPWPPNWQPRISPRHARSMSSTTSKPTHPSCTTSAANPQWPQAERELRVALAEKMILDFDYLPLPAIPGAETQAAKRPAASRSTCQSRPAVCEQRRQWRRQVELRGIFRRSRARGGQEMVRLSGMLDEDGFVSREEFLPSSPVPKTR